MLYASTFVPRVPDQLDRRSVPSFVHAYGSSTSRSSMRSSSREAPAYAALIYSWCSGSRYGTGMGYAFTYAIGFQTKDALVCKWIRNRLWIHRPWIFYRLLRNRFFNDLWFNPGNADLNPEAMVWQWILNPPIWTISGFPPPFLETASVAQVDLVGIVLFFLKSGMLGCLRNCYETRTKKETVTESRKQPIRRSTHIAHGHLQGRSLML